MAQLEQPFPITSQPLGVSVPHFTPADVCDILSVSVLHVTSVCPTHTECSFSTEGWRVLSFFGPHFLAYKMEALCPMVTGA